MDTSLFEKLSKRIDGYRDDMIEMQKTLIPMQAISPTSGGKGEYKKGKYLESLLSKVFDTVNTCDASYKEAEGGIRPNYAAVLKGKSPDRTLWIMAHMDVVPAGERKLWDTEPFEAVIKDGKIYGRGSEDNNQAIISGFFAAKAFKDEGVTPPCNIGLLLVSDEECGNTYGAEYVLREHKDLFGKDDVFLVPDSGNPTGSDIEIAEKSTVWFKVTVNGKQAHAAHPKDGINTLRIASHIITKMDELYTTYPNKDPLFAPEDTSTFEPTMKLQNVTSVNTIPGKDVFYFDCRLLPSQDSKAFIDSFKSTANDIAAKFGATLEFELPHYVEAAPPTSMEEPFILSLSKAVKDVYGVEGRPMGTGGNTVAQNFREAGFPCAVYSRLDETLHGPNEYCVIDSMVGDTKIWCYVCLNEK